MCAYVCPSVRMYLSASCVRVSMLAFVRVRVYVTVRPSVRPSVCLSTCMFCVQMFVSICVPSSMHAFVCLHARVREGVCESVRPSARLSVCPVHVRAPKYFVRTCVRSSRHARHFLFLTSNFLLLNSNFLLLTSNFYFHLFTWMCASVRTCVRTWVPECIMSACKHASVRVCACVREGLCAVRPSVCPHACSCVQMFVHACVLQCMRDISYF